MEVKNWSSMDQVRCPTCRLGGEQDVIASPFNGGLIEDSPTTAEQLEAEPNFKSLNIFQSGNKHYDDRTFDYDDRKQSFSMRL